MRNPKNVLAVFAHPDDETLGAGGTLAKLVDEGSNVYVAIAATGITSRKSDKSEDEIQSALKSLKGDFVDAMACLGIPESNLVLGTFRDNMMDTHSRLEVNQWVEGLIEKFTPDTIFTHHRFCTNIDHQYCHEAVVIATRPSLNQHINVYTSEILSSTGYLKPAQWEPQLFVEIKEKHLKQKINAMKAYEGESRKDPHPRSEEVINALAKLRGADAGYYFAESFMVQKSFLTNI